MDTLWSALEALSRPAAPDADRLHCVRLSLADGASFDAYRAELGAGPVTMWRVRGFHAAGGQDAQEGQAVVLGTQDGRAVLRWDGGMTAVSGHEPTTRAMADLSEVMARAVRRLMDPA